MLDAVGTKPSLVCTRPSASDDCVQGSTELKVVTDGCLLREVLGNPLLSAYSAVIVDDVQQRSASTDVLLGLLRKVRFFSFLPMYFLGPRHSRAAHVETRVQGLLRCQAAPRCCGTASTRTSSGGGGTARVAVQILRKRTDLKLVLVTSSAHDLPKLQAFFKPHAQASGPRSTQVAVLAVRGAEHMVQKHYLSVRR